MVFYKYEYNINQSIGTDTQHCYQYWYIPTCNTMKQWNQVDIIWRDNGE